MRRTWFFRGTGLAAIILMMAAVSAVIGSDAESRPSPQPPQTPGSPLSGLLAGETALFDAGKIQFESVEDAAEGLGPVFNESSCVACHFAGGTGGGADRLETRFGRWDEHGFDPLIEVGGSLVQDRGIGLFNGVNFVGEVVPPQARVVARRRATPLFGLGLVDAIPDDSLVMLSGRQMQMDPETAGRPSHIIDPGPGEHVVGRFGWKAQHATLFAFSGDAYLNELGVTTPLFPDENCPHGECALLAVNPALTSPNDPDNSPIQALADFVTFLAPPPRGPVGRSELAGRMLFKSIGCATCHNPSWQTGGSPVKALNNVDFSPYSDFLLHDMGRLGDGIPQSDAGPREMRTAPLWGLRFQNTLLHDGRAGSVAKAILQHDGQGRLARNRFADLSDEQSGQLLDFLHSL
jgi:CxxC motif-containing protein (DUF1111 family)